MTMTKTDPRGITLDILLEVLEEGRLGHLVLNQALLKYQYLEKQDRSFITKLTEKIPGAFRLCQRSPADSFKGKGKAGIYGSVGALFHSRMDAFHVGG